MRCGNCGADNAAGARFCNQCAAPLGKRCPQCASDNAPDAKFCAQCAAPLDPGPPAHAEDAPRAGFAGERRHLTVLFCDLVGSTAITAQLDPEEWRDTVAAYQRAAADAIARFGGHVAKYLGDGVMAFFGWPEAHDNDAERAARAGLAILDAIARLNEQPAQPILSARIGVDSGPVVVGAGAGKDADVFGEPPNIAARAQEAAAPGTVVATENTHRLIAGLFAVEDRGTPPLKGIERPIRLHRIIRPTGAGGRFKAMAARGLTPFVGREDELRLLLNRWDRALDGEGQVALIVGEAGIGKSRLVHRFHEQIAAASHAWIEAGAAQFYQNTPFYPVSEALRQMVWEHSFDRLDDYLREMQTDGEAGNGGALRADESAGERLERLRSGLAQAGISSAETLRLVAPLLSLPLPTSEPPSPLSPEQQRRRLLAALIEWVIGTAREQPLVIAIEDLHWADPSTLELIQLLAEQTVAAPLLLLFTARPEFRPQWPLRAHHTQINLNRLSGRDVRAMVEQVAARAALSQETLATVAERTGGVPLFVEELTRAVLESGQTNPAGRAIPATLHDSLMARLDRLGPAKEVLQIGAVIGAEFSYELLRAVYPAAEPDLERALRAAADAELLYVRGIAPNATYQFKHALIRDAAYEALLKSRRRELHRRVGQTIDEQFAALKESHPEVLARHWTEAGETERAIEEWARAGKAAETRNAFNEALKSYQRALSLLNDLPDLPNRGLRELELTQSMVSMLYVTKGFSARESIDAIERAVQLAEEHGDLARVANWVMSKGVAALVSGDYSAAGALADQALDLALRDGKPSNLGTAYCLQLQTRYFCGDLSRAERYFLDGLPCFDDPGFRQYPGGAAGVLFAFGTASWNAWIAGQADLARERMARTIAAANGGSSYDVATSDTLAAILYIQMRNSAQAQLFAEQALRLAEKHELPLPEAISRCALGCALSRLDRTAEGIALIQHGIAVCNEVGMRINLIAITSWLAEAQAHAGGSVEAIKTIEEALQVNPQNLAYRPEALRLRGEIHLSLNQPDLAETDFRESIALAQQMGAKAWELRSTMSLARLLAAQNRREQARAMLAEIHGWFTEGFDTADLKDAKTLLDELSG